MWTQLMSGPDPLQAVWSKNDTETNLIKMYSLVYIKNITDIFVMLHIILDVCHYSMLVFF